MTETTRMDIKVNDKVVFSYVRGKGTFKITDVEVIVYDENVDNRKGD